MSTTSIKSTTSTIEITDSEFTERIKRIQALIVKENLDGLLAFSTESEPAYTRYFSDYWPNFETAGVLIPADGEAALLIGPESQTYASARSRLPNIIRMDDFRESSQPEYPGTSLPGWSDVLKRFKIKKLGLAGWHMFPYAMMVPVQEALGVDGVAPADHLVRKLMIVKSEAELRCLRESARISVLGFQAALEKITAGMTEAQVVGLATAQMLANGAESTGYTIWCCSGPNTTQAISRPTLRKIQKGEIAHVQVGAKVEGYSTSVARPLIIGSCDADTRRFLQVGCDAEQMTIESLCDGTPACDVAKKVHDWINSRGYGDTILYGPAHGCGQMECEWPFIETSSDVMLRTNMTFQADVFLAQATQGFRWEDGVVVKEGRGEELAPLKRELLVV